MMANFLGGIGLLSESQLFTVFLLTPTPLPRVSRGNFILLEPSFDYFGRQHTPIMYSFRASSRKKSF